MRRLRKALVFIGVLLGVCVLSALVLIAEENLRGQFVLRRVTNRLRATHEPLTLAALALPDFSQGKDAGRIVVKAGQELDALAKANPLAGEGPSGMMEQVEPGRAVAQHQSVTFLALHGKYGTGKGDKPPIYEWAQLERELANAEGPLNKLRQALAQQPLAAPTVDYHARFGMTQAELPWRTYAWLVSASMAALHARNLDAATDNLVALVSLTEYQGRDFRVTAQVPGIVVHSYTLPLVWEALQEDGWTEAQLVRLQSALARVHPLADMIRSVEVERSLIAERFAQTREHHEAQLVAFRLDGHNLMNDLLSDNEVSYPSEGVVWLKSVLWRAAWSQQDEARALERWQAFLGSVRQLRQEKSWTAFAQRCPADDRPLEGVARWKYPFSELLGPQSGRLLLQRGTRIETGRQMMLAAIALKRYTLQTGMAAPSLEALVPEFLSEVPTDWMDGKSLRYRAQEGKSFALYSVGTDGRDDGGDPKPARESKMRDIWLGRDVVWPVAVGAH